METTTLTRARGVLALPAGYDAQRQVAHNTRMKRPEVHLRRRLVALLVLFGGLIPAGAASFRRRTS
jgi:hypothetical protein